MRVKVAVSGPCETMRREKPLLITQYFDRGPVLLKAFVQCHEDLFGLQGRLGQDSGFFRFVRILAPTETIDAAAQLMKLTPQCHILWRSRWYLQKAKKKRLRQEDAMKTKNSSVRRAPLNPPSPVALLRRTGIQGVYVRLNCRPAKYPSCWK